MWTLNPAECLRLPVCLKCTLIVFLSFCPLVLQRSDSFVSRNLRPVISFCLGAFTAWSDWSFSGRKRNGVKGRVYYSLLRKQDFLVLFSTAQSREFIVCLCRGSIKRRIVRMFIHRNLVTLTYFPSPPASLSGKMLALGIVLRDPDISKIYFVRNENCLKEM